MSDQSSQYMQLVAEDPRFLHADDKDSDWASRLDGLPRLIRVFAGRTGHFVGFVTRRLKSVTNITSDQIVTYEKVHHFIS